MGVLEGGGEPLPAGVLGVLVEVTADDAVLSRLELPGQQGELAEPLLRIHAQMTTRHGERRRPGEPHHRGGEPPCVQAARLGQQPVTGLQDLDAERAQQQRPRGDPAATREDHHPGLVREPGRLALGAPVARRLLNADQIGCTGLDHPNQCPPVVAQRPDVVTEQTDPPPTIRIDPGGRQRGKLRQQAHPPKANGEAARPQQARRFRPPGNPSRGAGNCAKPEGHHAARTLQGASCTTPPEGPHLQLAHRARLIRRHLPDSRCSPRSWGYPILGGCPAPLAGATLLAASS